MTNPSINFRVGGEEVSSFMDKLRQKSESMTAQFIREAQIQTSSAKEQLRLLEEKIKATQRLAVLQKQLAEATVKDNTNQRIANIEGRGRTIDSLYERNKEQKKELVERYRAGEITEGEYRSGLSRVGRARKRIEFLGEENTEEAIRKQADVRLREVREAERNNQILASYMRENINTIRQTSQTQVGEIRQGNERLVDTIDDTATPQERLVQQLTRQQITQERGAGEGEGWRGKMSGLASFANALAVDRVGGMIAGIPGSNNELDYIKPMMSTMGLLLGGLPGIIADMATGTSILGFSLGQSTFGQLGMQLGSKMGEFAGESIGRTYKGRDLLQTSNLKLKGLGFLDEVDRFGDSYKSDGDNSSYQLGGTGMFRKLNQDYSQWGMDMVTVSKLQSEIATRRGSTSSLFGDTESVIGVKGVGVQEQTSLSLLELLRSNTKTDKDLSNIVGGVLNKGMFRDGDRAYLNEFLTKNYTQLQKTLLSTQTHVNSGVAADILDKFNNIGGQFGMKDFRSSGLISGIQSGLANPNSDSMKALMFSLMRKEYPEMDLADIQIEMQKGLGSPKQLQSFLKFVREQGGTRGYKMQQIAGAFGLQGNLSAAMELLEGSEKFGDSFSLDKLSAGGQFTKGGMMGMSRDLTSPFSASTAEIENEFVKSSVDGIKMVGSKMKALMGDMLDGLQIYIKAEVNKMLGTSNSKENSIRSGRKVPQTIYPGEKF